MRLYSALRAAGVAAAVLVILAAGVGYVSSGGATDPAGYEGSRPAAAGEDTGDCERLRTGALAQPASAWSALAIVAVGLGLVAAFAAGRAPAGAAAPIRSRRPFAAALAAAIIVAGAGSFAFHRAPTAWSGWLDSAGVAAIPLVWAVYDVAILRRWETRRFIAVLMASAIPVGAVLWWVDGAGSFLTPILAGGALAAELALARRRRLGAAPRRDPEWLFGMVATLAVAVPIFVVSRTGRPWCDPEALLQGHAVWHVLAAVAIAFGLAYLWSERPQPAGP